MAKKKSRILDELRAELGDQSSINKEFPTDDEFQQERFKTSDIKTNEEEAIIDELLASVPRGQGHYLKLYKEISPNNFELKQRIDDYETWTDLELEITNIVRAYTLKTPQKWGSGHYRLVIWREGGIRGPKFKPIDFYVDAQELANDNKNTNVVTPVTIDTEAQIKSMSEMLRVMREVNPTVSPVDTQKMIAESYQAGLKASGDKESSSGTMMATIMSSMVLMMTEMIKSGKSAEPTNPSQVLSETLKSLDTLGLLQKNKDILPDKRESLLSLVKELQSIGLWEAPKKEDTLAEIGKLKQLLDLVGSLSPQVAATQPTSFGVEIVKTLGPQIPAIVERVTNTVDKVVELSKTKLEAQMHNPITRPILAEVKPKNIRENPVMPASEGQIKFFHPLLGEIYQYIQQNDASKYDYIHSKLTGMFPGTKLNNAEEALSILVNIGGEPFNNQETYNYVSNFVNFINSKNENLHEVVTHCPLCSAEFTFQSKEYFEKLGANERMCGERLDDNDPTNICQGMLILKEPSSKGNGTTRHVEEHIGEEDEHSVLVSSVEQTEEKNIMEKV